MYIKIIYRNRGNSNVETLISYEIRKIELAWRAPKSRQPIVGTNSNFTFQEIRYITIPLDRNRDIRTKFQWVDVYIYRGVWAVARPVIKAVYASLGPGARDTSTCPSDYGVLVAKADRPYRELNLILKQALKGVGRAYFSC